MFKVGDTVVAIHNVKDCPYSINTTFKYRVTGYAPNNKDIVIRIISAPKGHLAHIGGIYMRAVEHYKLYQNTTDAGNSLSFIIT